MKAKKKKKKIHPFKWTTLLDRDIVLAAFRHSQSDITSDITSGKTTGRKKARVEK